MTTQDIKAIVISNRGFYKDINPKITDDELVEFIEYMLKDVDSFNFNDYQMNIYINGLLGELNAHIIYTEEEANAEHWEYIVIPYYSWKIENGKARGTMGYTFNSFEAE